MLWVGMGGHRSLLMGLVWVWVQFEGKCWALLCSVLNHYIALKPRQKPEQGVDAKYIGQHFTCYIKNDFIYVHMYNFYTCTKCRSDCAFCNHARQARKILTITPKS